jgi:beta-phosphoglucomutase-like phosphatase (HAD superfamily)
MAAIPGSGKALLFDIDGTLADTDALHLQASVPSTIWHW